MNKLSKILVTIVLVSLLGNAFVFPKKANAQIPGAFVPTHAPIEHLQTLFEWAQTFVLTTLKKQLLDRLVDQIIVWIQGGGKPQFVTDWRGFLRDSGNAAAGDAAILAGLGFLCQPFNLRLQIDLTQKRFTQQIQCTLDQIVGNIENFYNDFRNGRWIGYSLAWEPQNNYYGAYLLTWEARNKAAAEAEGSAALEAMSGGGFLSTKTCTEKTGDIGPDIDRDGTPGDIQSTCTITTPGDTIGSVVSKAVGSDIDFILSADQLGDYVAAIANALINRIIISGVQGLQGTRSGSTSAPRAPCSGLSGAALTACNNYIQASNSSFTSAQNNLIGQIDQNLIPRQATQSLLDDSVNRLQVYLSDLQNMLNSFTSLTCSNKDNYVAAVNAEIQWVNSILPDLLTEQSKNQNNIKQLSSAKASVQNLAANNWTGFTNIASQLQSSGALDPTGAANAQTAATNQNNAIKDRISQKLPILNENLQECLDESP